MGAGANDLMKRMLLAAAVVLGLLAPRAANASSINFNCGTCGNHNTSFDITYALVNAGTNTYDLTIVATYQPAGAGVPDFVYLNDVAFKLEGVASDSTPSFVSGPAEDTWSLIFGGIGASGCNGSGAGYFCFRSTGFGATHGAAGTTDTWVARLDLTAALGTTVPLALKAQFTNADGGKVGSLVSNDGTGYLRFEQECEGLCAQAVPEPTTLVLFGGGLAIIAAGLRRSRARQK
jgi:hypothetical protein